jgi:serine/threonine protein kinase
MKQGTQLTIGTAEVVVGKQFAQGDLCDVHHCTYSKPEDEPDDASKGKDRWEVIMGGDSGPKDLQGALKVVRGVGDNDLASNEARVLGHLYPPEAKDEKFYRYLPRLLGAVEHEGRQTNVFTFLEDYVSMAAVLEAYPNGIDYRDLAWMFKRLLVAIGFAHSRGVVHGAVLPPHVMIHPTGHGAKLIDWSYAVKSEDKTSIRAYPAPWRAYYAPEVFAKQLPTAATDIYMAAKCCVALLGGSLSNNELPASVPDEVQSLLAECLVEAPSQRPQDAWDLHERFDGLLRKLVGKPKYRPFQLPV